MSKAHYFTSSKSRNDTGYDSYSQPFHSSDIRKEVCRAIQQFKLDFPESKMVWIVGIRYLTKE